MKKVALRFFMVGIVLLLISTTNFAAVESVTTENECKKIIEQSAKPVIIRFYAKWCSACKKIEKIFTDLAVKYADQYVFVQVDVDQCGKVANAFEVKGVPVFLFFKNGKQVDSMVGAVSQKEFEEKINKAF